MSYDIVLAILTAASIAALAYAVETFDWRGWWADRPKWGEHE